MDGYHQIIIADSELINARLLSENADLFFTFLLAELFDLAFSIYYRHGDNTDDANTVLMREVTPFAENLRITKKDHQSFLRAACGVADAYSSVNKGMHQAALPLQMSTSYAMLAAGVHGSYQALSVVMLCRWAKHLSGENHFILYYIQR